MSAARDVLQSIGCDYITCLAKKAAGWHPLKMHSYELLRTEEQKGNKLSGFGMSGFSGFKCGGVQVGQRDDEFLCRLSSDAAALNWTTVYEVSDNVSRIDLQATVRVIDGPTKRIERERKLAEANAASVNTKRVVRWVQDNQGGFTCYLGVRGSNCFGRVYDKFAQSSLDHYRECVRYEVQYHDKLARFVARTVFTCDSPIPRVASYISQFFSGRGVNISLPYEDGARYSCSRPRSDNDKTLEWLASSVRPSVIRLIDAGRGEEVMRALGLVTDAEVDGNL